MSYLAKVVTVILLATLSLAPAVAAVPCEQGVSCMACCSGLMCPMTAQMMSREMMAHKGMTEASAPACENAPHTLAVVTDRQGSDVPGVVAHLNRISYVLPALRTRTLREEHAEIQQRYGPRAQAILSTFLI